MKRWTILGALASAVGLVAGNANAEDVTGVLPKFPVMSGEIDPQSFTTLAGGQKIYFCCPACEKKLFDDPAEYAPKAQIR